VQAFEAAVPQKRRLELFQLSKLKVSSWGLFDWQPDFNDAADKWYHELSEKRHETPLMTLHYFGYRPYWQRLWIIWELFKAKDVKLLCGNNILSWDSLHALCRLFVAADRNPKRLKALPPAYDEPFITQLVAFSPMGSVFRYVSIMRHQLTASKMYSEVTTVHNP
jgi:hypothetical protein